MAAEESTPQIGPIESFMTEDHVLIDRLLLASTPPKSADAGAGPVDDIAYRAFRGALLRHIAMEEKVLLPFVRARRGAPFEAAERLREDHSEIAKLLVRSPSPMIIEQLQQIFVRHNPLEEGRAGLYAICDAIAGAGAEALVQRLRDQPEVPQAKYYDGPIRGRRS